MRFLKSILGISSFVHPNLNYVDFDELLKDSEQLRNTIKMLLFSLTDRGIGNINATSIWKEYNESGDYTEILQVLAGLEAFTRVCNNE
jgi:hypothetical protein